MSQPPLRKPGGRGEAKDSLVQADQQPNESFRLLATKLLKVPIDDIREAEKRYLASRSGKENGTD